MNERAAVERLKRGDVAGLETLVGWYHTRAARAAYLIARDRMLAEDVAQGAFVRAYERNNVAYGGDGIDLLEPIGEGEVSGGPGADFILAHNDKRNTISCGAGKDTVYFDEALDSPAADCEMQVPHQFKPPNNEPFSS